MYRTIYSPRAAGFDAVTIAPVVAWVAPLDAASRMNIPGCAPNTGTVTPLMVTTVPPSCCGQGDPGAMSVCPGAAPRFEPKIVRMPPGAIPGWKLAALVIPAPALEIVMEGPFPAATPEIFLTR